ncbi:DUF5337 family protein [Albidovulum sp.]|uniref:DUF5337 family protein n=1 Tax=Albidovulum sp. TaxID=1872424 RepID=UPI002C28A95C|nr:DUF5337 domain-containing protein [Paracoccaceae bacterium]HPE27012.1 DUF5337 family protein [Albidovulum sp.]
MAARKPDEVDMSQVRQARLVAIVIAVAGALWVAAQWLVEPTSRYAALFDLMALAAFIWAFAVTWRIWRRTRRQER